MRHYRSGEVGSSLERLGQRPSALDAAGSRTNDRATPRLQDASDDRGHGRAREKDSWQANNSACDRSMETPADRPRHTRNRDPIHRVIVRNCSSDGRDSAAAKGGTMIQAPPRSGARPCNPSPRPTAAESRIATVAIGARRAAGHAPGGWRSVFSGAPKKCGNRRFATRPPSMHTAEERHSSRGCVDRS